MTMARFRPLPLLSRVVRVSYSGEVTEEEEIMMTCTWAICVGNSGIFYLEALDPFFPLHPPPFSFSSHRLEDRNVCIFAPLLL